MQKIKLEEQTLTWLKNLKEKHLDKNASWIGVYWLESFIDPSQKNSTDLILGPYIGFETPHVRISLQSGLCGRAIRENQTLNIPDVLTTPEYLSCSFETKSEIVIPILNKNGSPIGELDIDSKIINGFSRELENKLKSEVHAFEKILTEQL
jgi:putative methionine-R-sulfoxide reductase with GAF domain